MMLPSLLLTPVLQVPGAIELIAEVQRYQERLAEFERLWQLDKRVTEDERQQLELLRERISHLEDRIRELLKAAGHQTDHNVDDGEALAEELLAEEEEFFETWLRQANDISSQEFIRLVQLMRKKGGKVDEKALQDILHALPRSKVKELEKHLLLWPTSPPNKSRWDKIVGIVADFTRLTDQEESERGRFAVEDGANIKQGLDRAVEDFKRPEPTPTDPDNVDEGFGRCLDFLFSESLDELFADEADEVDEAKSNYAAGVSERTKGLHKDGTLSRLAAELRTKGLTGPVNLLKWKGTKDSGEHEPHPADLFDRLSSAGDGWYFFLVSLFSFHTFVVAVEVSNGNRTYFEIQGGQSVKKSRDKLKAWFDKEFDPFPHTRIVGSKVWQIYLQPSD